MSTKRPFGRNEWDATLEILRSSWTELPIMRTELPILGRQFQNERTVRQKYHFSPCPETGRISYTSGREWARGVGWNFWDARQS